MAGELSLPRQLRHDLRGRMNSLRLCATALATDCTPQETLEFLEDIEKTCDSIVDLVAQIEALPENAE